MQSQSRVHRLRSFPGNFYIKRDDELSFGVSGSKWRKALSLIPTLKERGIKRAFLIGSAHSNNVLGLAQLLIENGITPWGFLLKPHGALEGNFLFTQMLLDKIFWIERSDWPLVTRRTQEMAKEADVVIPEGANMPESYRGAQTLAWDIERNEEELGFKFDHLFLDAGTGLMARACAEAFEGRKLQIHIVKMAPCLSDWALPSCHFYTPDIGKSFGSTSKSLFDFIAQFAKTEGVFLDPLYSAKLFYQAQIISLEKELKGPSLIVHSGGALALSGFFSQLKKEI